MNDTWGYDTSDASQDNDQELTGPRALRDAYKALKAQNDELNQKLTSFLETQEKARIATVFETLGAPQAASLYKGEADPEKAREWFQNMQAVFGGNQGSTPQVADSSPGLSQETQDQFQRMTQAGSDGVPMGNIEAAQAAVGSATSIQDLMNVYKNGTF